MHLDNWVVIMKTEDGVYVWSKHQNSYFWGGLGNSTRYYSRHYAEKTARIFTAAEKQGVEAVSEEAFRVVWQHKLSGKDLFNGFAGN